MNLCLQKKKGKERTYVLYKKKIYQIHNCSLPTTTLLASKVIHLTWIQMNPPYLAFTNSNSARTSSNIPNLHEICISILQHTSPRSNSFYKPFYLKLALIRSNPFQDSRPSSHKSKKSIKRINTGLKGKNVAHPWTWSILLDRNTRFIVG